MSIIHTLRVSLMVALEEGVIDKEQARLASMWLDLCLEGPNES